MTDETNGTVNTEKITSSNKIAFCFLVRETLNQPSAWESFLANHEEEYQIYCHPKHKEKVTIKLFKDNIIDENVPTKWGDISVTKAIIALLRAAYKDPNNKKFCLFSESCAPLARSFDDVKEEICSHNKSYFDFMNLSDYRRRYTQLQQSPLRPRGGNNNKNKNNNNNNKIWIPQMHFKKHATWFIMDRKHVEQILKVQKKYTHVFNKVTVPDEHFFATVLCNEGRVSELIPKQTTFVDWDTNNFWFLKKQSFFLKWGLHVEKAGGVLPSKMPNSKLIGRLPKVATKEWKELQQLDSKMWSEDLVAHPRTFKTVAQDDIDKMRLSKCFFARKFSVESNYSTVFTMDLLASKIGGGLNLFGGNSNGNDDNNANFNGNVGNDDNNIDDINMITGRYDVPIHLQSQIFYDMQGMMSYVDSTIRELDAKHKYEIDKLNNINSKKMNKALSKQKNDLLKNQRQQQQQQNNSNHNNNNNNNISNGITNDVQLDVYDEENHALYDNGDMGGDGLLLSPALLLSNFEENHDKNNDDDNNNNNKNNQDHDDILDVIKNVRAEEADENMARKLLSHYDAYRNYSEDEFDLEDEEDEDANGVNSFEAHYSFDGQGLEYDDQEEEDDEEVMLGF